MYLFKHIGDLVKELATNNPKSIDGYIHSGKLKIKFDKPKVLEHQLESAKIETNIETKLHMDGVIDNHFIVKVWFNGILAVESNLYSDEESIDEIVNVIASMKWNYNTNRERFTDEILRGFNK